MLKEYGIIVKPDLANKKHQIGVLLTFAISCAIWVFLVLAIK